MPQSIQTMSELMDFASVPYHIITPKDGSPVIEVVQDTMLGAYRLTKNHVRMRDKTFANLQMVNSYFTGALPSPKDAAHHLFSGRQLYSAITPPGFYMKTANKKKMPVMIENGEYVDDDKAGPTDKKVYTDMSKGMLPLIFHDYGPFEVRRFLDNLQRTVCRWLMTSGFSVGISDLVITEKEVMGKLQESIKKMKEDAYKVIKEVRDGEIKKLTMFENNEYLEQELMRILNEATKLASDVGANDDNINRMMNMVNSGSKGKDTNIQQMMACVGQQNVDGKRVGYGYTDRTLPHYVKFDDGPEARGFVTNSFIGGLTPQEVFFHAMGGREGLIDTAVKTSETGYLQRRLIKAMEDCKVYYDQTVRNASGSIVQFIYGEDGMEGTKVEKQRVPTIDQNVFEIAHEHLLVGDKEDKEALKSLKIHMTKAAYDKMNKDKTWKARCRAHYEALLDDRDFIITKVYHKEHNDTVTYPVPFARILSTACNRMKQAGIDKLPADITPAYILDKIDELKRKLYVTDQAQGMRFFHVLLHAYLSPKPLILKHHMKQAMFDWMCGEVERYFKEALCPAGEMVGIIAAQSIGEPSTQLSCAKNTCVRILSGNDLLRGSYNGDIGSFVDALMENHKDKVMDLGNDSTALYLPQDYYVIGVGDDEKTSWRRILEVSRHPAHGGMVTAKTRSGRQTTATLSHSFLKRTKEGKIVPIEGSKLKIGDRIPVARRIPVIENPLTEVEINGHVYRLDKSLGTQIGAYLADGKSPDAAGLEWICAEFAEHIPAWVFSGNLDFINGILDAVMQQGEFTGHTLAHAHDMSVLLAYTGTFAVLGDDGVLRIQTEDDHIPECAEVVASACDALHMDLISDSSSRDIGRRTLQKYIELFKVENAKAGNLPDVAQHIALLEQAVDSSVVWDEIVELEYSEDPKEYVYDFTVPGNDSFMVDCGVIVHNTLDSFHVSGTAAAVKATSGVPRLKELLSVSRNIKTPSLNIYLKPDIATVFDPAEDGDGDVKDERVNEAKMRAMQVLNQLEITRLSELVEKTEIYFDPVLRSEDGAVAEYSTNLTEDKGMMEIYNAFEDLSTFKSDSPWVLRIKINKAKMNAKDLSMMDIYIRLFQSYQRQIECLFTDDNAEELIFRIRLVREDTKADKDGGEDDTIAALKALEHNVLHNVLIKGTAGIQKVSMHTSNRKLYSPETQKFHAVSEWVLDTDGTNLQEILANPNVDAERTISNDVWEIYECLGVEAARAAIYNEVMSVIGENSVNYRHLSLLIDTMTHRGFLFSVDRHGINRGDIGPLAKSSFEETTDMLINASVFSDYDRINGVSANIMLGQLPPCGTGDSDILLDEHKYMVLLSDALKRAHKNARVRAADMDDEGADAGADDGLCNIADLMLDIKIPEKKQNGCVFELPKVVFAT